MTNEFMFNSHMRCYVTQWSATRLCGGLIVYSTPSPRRSSPVKITFGDSCFFCCMCNKANRRGYHAGKMSEEKLETTNGDQPSTRKAKIFTVNQVRFDQTLTDPLDEENDNERRKVPDANVPKSSTAPDTYGYRTFEAIPSTIFYRSLHSQGHAAKQRPTLRELRKGLDNDEVGETGMFNF